jgi:microcin C transport system permease protein
MFNLNPETLKKIRRFRQIKRGYYSFLTLMFLVLLFLVGELLINNRALIVKYEGQYFFPTYTAFHPGSDFVCRILTRPTIAS